VKGLQLHALVWEAAGIHLRLNTSVTEMAVVVAEPSAASALADVLVGLSQPVGGAVRLDGRNVTGLPPGHRGITLVPPGGALLPHLTVERNVAYGCRRADRSRIRRRVQDLKLESIRGLRPHELSPVQRLQVAVARALCQEHEPGAIVIEDRHGEAPCRAAVAAARAQDVAVLVITDRAYLDTSLGGPLRPEAITDAP
jgi:ABC-type thiamine transport system ATPase subunit